MGGSQRRRPPREQPDDAGGSGQARDTTVADAAAPGPAAAGPSDELRGSGGVRRVLRIGSRPSGAVIRIGGERVDGARTPYVMTSPTMRTRIRPQKGAPRTGTGAWAAADRAA